MLLPRPVRSGATALLLAALLLPVGCGGEPEAPEAPPGLVDREVFIATYVDLREAALLHGEPLADTLREEVLERHGVTGDELLEFAEVRGADVGWMQDVWAEVAARLEARRLPADSLAGS